MDAVERMVPVFSCAGRMDAELRRGALEASGIRAVVATDTAGGLHPELVSGSCGAVRILVPDHEVDRARDVLAELDEGVHALPDSVGDEPVTARSGSMAGLWLVVGVLVAVTAYRLWQAWQVG